VRVPGRIPNIGRPARGVLRLDPDLPICTQAAVVVVAEFLLKILSATLVSSTQLAMEEEEERRPAMHMRTKERR
jgi:hypothetical protein